MAKGAIQGQEFLTKNEANGLYLTPSQADSKYSTKQELANVELKTYSTTVGISNNMISRVDVSFEPIFAIMSFYTVSGSRKTYIGNGSTAKQVDSSGSSIVFSYVYSNDTVLGYSISVGWEERGVTFRATTAQSGCSAYITIIGK